jgi:hypothetical protein
MENSLFPAKIDTHVHFDSISALVLYAVIGTPPFSWKIPATITVCPKLVEI